MKSIHLILLGLFALSCSTVAQLSQTDQQLIVNFHNQLRISTHPTAANMLQIAWEDFAATSAQNFVNLCPQNLEVSFLNTGEDGLIFGAIFLNQTQANLTAFLDSIALQQHNYNYTSNTCLDRTQNCFTYVQAVWAPTNYVGCAVRHCSFGYLYTCFYNPPGDYPGVLPYVSGTPCSQCPLGYICSNKLCVAGPTPVGNPKLVGYLPLNNDNDCDYNAHVTIDGVDFNLLIDSGSSNLAIITNKCSTCPSLPSYTGPLTNIPAAIEYGTVNFTTGFSGYVIDNLKINFGGLDLTLNAIGITSQSDFFPPCGVPSQGILGLAYDQISEDNLPLVPDVLTQEGTPNGFALQLCSNLPQAKLSSKTGNLWVGGYDSTFTTGPMQYAKITEKDFFGVQVNGFSLNGNPIEGLGNLNSAESIVDCGTTILLLPEQSFLALLSALKQAKAFTFHSLSESDIENFYYDNIALTSDQFSINQNLKLTIDFLGPNGENVPILIPPNNLVVRAFPLYYFGISYSSFPGVIVGETLFTNYVVFFDRGEGSRIGFAPATGCFDTATAAGIDIFATGTNIPCPSCDPKATCTNNANCICLPGWNGNGLKCSPNARTAQVTSYHPLSRSLFDGNNLDSSAHGNTFNTEGYSYVPFYQKGNPNNKALRVTSTPIILFNKIEFLSTFTVQIIFNIDVFKEFDIFSIIPTVSTSRSQSLLLLVAQTNGRISLVETGLHYLRTSNKVLKSGVTYSFVVSFFDGKVLGWLNDEEIINSKVTFSGGNYFLSVGNNLNGYIDEVGFYTKPITDDQITPFDSLLACDNSCSSGKVCYNGVNNYGCENN